LGLWKTAEREKSIIYFEQIGGQMKSASSWKRMRLVPAAMTICFTFAVSAGAQVETTSSRTSGTATKTTKVERGEVVLVQGNDLIVKMDDGTIRHFPNVPDSAKIMVNGQALSVHDLKPGMKLQRTITTTTTPETVKTVQTVTGTVWNVMPPTSVILTLEDGKNQRFTIPNGQKFNINGQMVDAWGLRQGMKVTATKIVETPEEVVSTHRQVTGTMPTPVVAAAPPPTPPPADVPILVVMVAETAPPPEAPAEKLPSTGSQLPAVGLLGLLCLFASLGLKLVRASVPQ
jgi:hypothetical protein